MLNRKLVKTSWCELRKRYLSNNFKEKEINSIKCDDSKIRNIGILAHIDAGKTTTTERMLYYSGLISHMGEVHHGNTVTDYLEQERERGITITSAAVTFNWKNHQFNLIDTPGHIDFTMEVEQSLRVLDGAIIILDGSAGVEAQTLTVCKQADRYKIPKIIYVNKMDRSDANFDMSLNSIEKKLGLNSLPVQIPVRKDGVLAGVVDLICLDLLIFDKGYHGMHIKRIKLNEHGENSTLWETAVEKRNILMDKLSGMDDELAEFIIQQESLDKVPAELLVTALRRATIARKGAPVLLGSSYKNIGVQPLMDSVILYLSSPNQNKYAKLYQCFGKYLAARAFKIIHDKQRGPVTFLRIYNGELKKGSTLYNVQREKSESVGRLYIPCANEYKEINDVGFGNIVGVTGLKSVITGDLITESGSAASRAKKLLEKCDNISPNEIEDMFAVGARIPDPVFFCSIEPPSLSQQKALEIALQQLSKEDPSLRIRNDEETGQTVLSGMGELHIDIIKERIKTEYKIDVELGPLQIAYKETIQNNVKNTYSTVHKVGSNNYTVTLTMSVLPNHKHKEFFILDKTADSASALAVIHPKVMYLIRKGVKAGLLHGPILSCPLMDVGVKLHAFETPRGTPDTIIISVIAQCIKKLLQDASPVLMEPIMKLEIIIPEEYATSITADLTRRRAQIQKIDVRSQNKIIQTLTPLAELLGYSTKLRTMTSGRGTFSLEFSHYEIMDSHEEQNAIKIVTGF